MPVTSKQVNKALQERFGIEVDFTSNPADLAELFEHYRFRKEQIVLREGGGEAMKTLEFAKAHLICEAIRIFLKEIAPRRMKKKRNKS